MQREDRVLLFTAMLDPGQWSRLVARGKIWFGVVGFVCGASAGLVFGLCGWYRESS